MPVANSVGTARRTRIPPIDVSVFATDVEAALGAFAADEQYAVLIARAAVTIARKREVWLARKATREVVPARRELSGANL